MGTSGEFSAMGTDVWGPQIRSGAILENARNGNLFGMPTPAVGSLLEPAIPSAPASSASGARQPVPSEQNSGKHGSSGPVPEDKRPKSNHSRDQHLTKGDLLDLFSGLRHDMSSLQNNIVAETQRTVEHALQGFEQRSNVRFEAVEAEVSRLRAADALREQQHDAVMQEIRSLRARFDERHNDAASSAGTTTSTSTPTSRSTDLTIIRANTTGITTTACLKSAVLPIFQRASLSESDFYIRSADNTIAKSWTIQVRGDVGLASARIKKTLATLRNTNGEWEKLFIDNPMGEQMPLYLSADKHPWQRLKETAGKKLLRVIAGMANSEQRCDLVKRDGVVCINYKPMAKIKINDGTANLLFIQANIPENMDAATIRQRFDDSYVQAADDQWSL